MKIQAKEDAHNVDNLEKAKKYISFWMDVAGLEGKDYTDKYETEAYKQRLMSKE